MRPFIAILGVLQTHGFQFDELAHVLAQSSGFKVMLDPECVGLLCLKMALVYLYSYLPSKTVQNNSLLNLAYGLIVCYFVHHECAKTK